MSLKWKVFILFVLHVVGIIGFTIDSSRSLFEKIIPVHLVVITVVLCFDRTSFSKELVIFFLISALVGFVAEVIGVKTHYLFGYYEYLEVLGPKFWDVPVLLGVLWFSTAYASNEICLRLFPEFKWVSIPAAAFVMMAFDFMIEPFAVSSGMWKWRDGVIPDFNYQSWFLVGLVLSFIYQKMIPAATNSSASYFIWFQIAFFVVVKYSIILF